MKKFIMITPLQPAVKDENGNVINDRLIPSIYQAQGNSKLALDRETRFPIIPVINGYVEEGEEFEVFAVTPARESCLIHLEQLREEVAFLSEQKNLVCKGVQEIPITYAGDVDTQIEIFRKLMDVLEDHDTLYGCLTFGDKPMTIALLMGMQYAYSVLSDVKIECVVYGQKDHSSPKGESQIFDITALIQLDEIVRKMASLKMRDPGSFLTRIIEKR